MAHSHHEEPLLGNRPCPGEGLRRPQSCNLAQGLEKESLKTKSIQRKLWAALVLAVVFMTIEVVGGFFANSLAIMTDAAHLLSDVSGFAVAIFAAYYGALKSGSTHTFGYHRIEVLGALASVLSTWLVTGVLVYEAVVRVITPQPVDGKLMFMLAMAGVAVNIMIFAILGGHHGHSHGSHDHSHIGSSHSGHAHEHGSSHGSTGCGHSHEHAGHNHTHNGPGHPNGHGGHEHAGHDHTHDEGADLHGHGGEKHHDGHSLNLRGAVVHAIGDMVQSIGVAAAGALIWWKQDDPRWRLADPICTFFFAILVLFTTRAILIDISDILMERVPRIHDLKTIQEDLQELDGVDSVHDLHVWGLKPGIALLAAHIEIHAQANPCDVLSKASAYCKQAGIHHSTIQVVSDGQECPCGPSWEAAAASLSQAEEGSAHQHH